MNSNKDQEDSLFVAREYQRAARLAIIGSVLILIVGGYVGIVILDRNRVVMMFLGLFLLLFDIQMLRQFFPIVRVDQKGLWRRRFWGWDLWPWEAFASERIYRGSSRTNFVSLDRPFWRNRLNLELLDKSEAETLISRIVEHWKPLNQNLAIENAIIDYSWPWRLRIEFDPRGIQVLDRSGTRAYRWDELEQIEIWTFSLDHDGFLSIEMRFSDRVILVPRLKQQRYFAHQYWSGSRSDEIAGIVRRFVEKERLQIWTLDGPARNQLEFDARIARFKNKLQMLEESGRIQRRVPWLLVFLCFLAPGWPANLRWFFLYGGIIEFVNWIMTRLDRQRFAKELTLYEERQRELFREQESRSGVS